MHAAIGRGGERLAVKVQYPGIRRSLEADMRQLAPSDRLIRTIFRKQEPGVLLNTLSSLFLQELDYQLEARHQKEMASFFADRADIHIPAVHDDLSTDSILTTTFADGVMVDAFAKSATQEERDRAGRALWEYFHLSIFRHERFPTDPHPGNFLFTTTRMTCLDFGRVQEFTPGFVERWRDVMRASVERDLAGVTRALHAIGYVPDANDFDFAYAHRAALVFYLPWLKDEPFTFTPDLLRQMWRVLLPGNANLARLNYPADMAFMTQFYFGIAALLARLGARVSCRDLVLDLLYPPGAARPAPFADAEIAAILA